MNKTFWSWLVLVWVLGSFWFGYISGQNDGFEEQLISDSSVSSAKVVFLTNCDVWNESKPIFDSGVMGYYSSRGYFAVVTKDRSIDEIARTTFHELSHVFNRMFPEHFIKDFNVSEGFK